MKKYIKTNKIKKSTNKIFVIIVIIPLIIAYNVFFSFYAFRDSNDKIGIKLASDNWNYTEQLPMKGCIVYSFIIGIPISLIISSWFLRIRKLNIKKSQFESIKDIEYFRDKLSKITPVEISLLTDLEVEDKKDLTALLLKYYKMGIIDIDANNTIRVVKKEDSLSNTDKNIINLIEQGNDNIIKLGNTNWKQLAIMEAINGKYLRANNAKTNVAPGIIKAFFMLCMLLLIAFLLLFSNGIAILEYLVYMLPNFYDGSGFINFCMVGIPAVILFVSLFKLPVLFIGNLAIEKRNKVRYARTKLGEEVTEYIYGLKNFIHDFSLLSEKDKEAICIWDDFLIYAVLLEENNVIINEIWDKSVRVPNIKFF